MTHEQLAALEAEVERLWQDMKAKEDLHRTALTAWCDAHDKLEAARYDAKLEADVQARLADRLAAERRGQEVPS